MDDLDHWCHVVSKDVVEPFLSALPLDKGTVLRQWTDHLETYLKQKQKSVNPPPSETVGPKKRTAYQRFFSEVFPRIRASQADGEQSFRDISQKIGQMWKILPDTEREKYRTPTSSPSSLERPPTEKRTATPTDSSVTGSSDSDVASPDRSHTLRNLTVRALGDLCCQHGLPKKGTKSVLIDRILRWEKSNMSSPSVPPPATHRPQSETDSLPTPSTREEEDAFAILHESSLDRVTTPTPHKNRTGREKIDFSRVLIVPEFPLDPMVSSTDSAGVHLVTTILETTQEDEDDPSSKNNVEEGESEDMVRAVGIDGQSDDARCDRRCNQKMIEDNSDEDAQTDSSEEEFDLTVMDEEGAEEEVGVGYDSEDA